MIMLSRRMMGLLPLLGLAVLVSACGGERPPPLPPDVTMTGDVDLGIRSTMAKFLARVRAHAVHGLARLDTNPHDSNWATARAGAAWLIDHYADALGGAMRVEVIDDSVGEEEWRLCLKFGAPERNLRLTVLETGKDGHFSPDGGYRTLLLAGFAEVKGAPKPNPSIPPGTFCAAGVVGLQWG